jgi:hypothetical protein
MSKSIQEAIAHKIIGGFSQSDRKSGTPTGRYVLINGLWCEERIHGQQPSCSGFSAQSLQPVQSVQPVQPVQSVLYIPPPIIFGISPPSKQISYMIVQYN